MVKREVRPKICAFCASASPPKLEAICAHTQRTARSLAISMKKLDERENSKRRRRENSATSTPRSRRARSVSMAEVIAQATS